MKTIKIICEHCNQVFEVRCTSEIPNDVKSLGCNWCPACEDEADEYYHEWYNFK